MLSVTCIARFRLNISTVHNAPVRKPPVSPGPLRSGAFSICAARPGRGGEGGEAGVARQASLGRLRNKIGQIGPQIVLIAVTFLVLGLMVGFLWTSMGTSITKLDAVDTYGALAMATLLVACLAIELRRVHQYASRLALISLLGLIVLLVGWGLRSV